MVSYLPFGAEGVKGPPAVTHSSGIASLAEEEDEAMEDICEVVGLGFCAGFRSKSLEEKTERAERRPEGSLSVVLWTIMDIGLVRRLTALDVSLSMMGGASWGRLVTARKPEEKNSE